MINQTDNPDLKNNEIKSLLIKLFGDSISYCDLQRKNQRFAFSSSVEMQEVINSMRNIDVVEATASEIKKNLYLILTLDLKIASVMHASSSNLGKK